MGEIADLEDQYTRLECDHLVGSRPGNVRQGVRLALRRQGPGPRGGAFSGGRIDKTRADAKLKKF